MNSPNWVSYISSDITIPLDFETEAHRGFAFVEFEDVADAAAAMDNMDEDSFHLFIIDQN